MKRMLFVAVIFAAMTFMSNAENSGSKGRFNAFYHNLKPYGYWIEVDNVIAWKPSRVNRNWQPYTYGRWIYTSYGWYWDSDEAYGDIVFHYGRWYYDDWEGWVWVPGYDWGPAWVEWRYDDDYIGWAPLSPYAIYNPNYGISFNIVIVSPYNHWRFIRFRDFHRHNIYDYYFTGYGAERFYERTNSFSNYKYRDRVVNEGIDPRIVEKRGGGNIKTRDIEFTNAKDRGNNKSDGSVKVRNVDFNRADRTDEKIEITRSRNTGNLRSDKIDEAARETTREVKRNENTRVIDRSDDNRAVVKKDNKPVTRDNGNTSRDVKKDDNKPVVRDNTSREVKREDNRPVVKDNTSREVKRDTPKKDNSSREVKRDTPKKDNTVRETPKRDNSARTTERGNSGGNSSSGGSRERKSR